MQLCQNWKRKGTMEIITKLSFEKLLFFTNSFYVRSMFRRGFHVDKLLCMFKLWALSPKYLFCKMTLTETEAQYWDKLAKLNKEYNKILRLFIVYQRQLEDQNKETIVQALILLELLESKPTTINVPCRIELLEAAEGRLKTWIKQFCVEIMEKNNVLK